MIIILSNAHIIVHNKLLYFNVNYNELLNKLLYKIVVK